VSGYCSVSGGGGVLAAVFKHTRVSWAQSIRPSFVVMLVGQMQSIGEWAYNVAWPSVKRPPFAAGRRNTVGLPFNV